MKKLLFLITFLFISFSLWAKSATVSITRLEHNVILNGEKCLAIHLKVNAIGYQHKKINCTVYIEHPKGTGVRDLNGKYCTKTNKVAAYTNITASYTNSSWKDLVIYLPNNELHLLSGKRTYYVKALLRYNGNIIARSNYDTFSATGNKKQSNKKQPKRNHQNHNHNNGGYPAGGYPGGYGGYPAGGGYSGGSSSGSSSTRRTCPSCNGTGKGMDKIHYSPNYTGEDNSRYCSQCGYTASAHTHIRQSCPVCYGKGYVGN